MTNQSSLNDSDVFPFIRGSNNFSATVGTIANHVLGKFTSFLGSVLSYGDATTSTKVPVVHEGATRYMTLNGILHFVHSNFFLSHIDMGSVAFASGEPSSNVIQGFHNEMAGTPQIIATVRSSTNGIYKINISDVDKNFFSFTVKKYNNGTWENTTDALSVQYIAVYRAWSGN